MAFRKWSPCNEVRWHYFSGELAHRAWLCNSFPFRIIFGCIGTWRKSAVACEASWLPDTVLSPKRGTSRPWQLAASSVSQIYLETTVSRKKIWKKKSMFTSRTRGTLTLDPPFFHRLSFLFRSIETVRRGYHLRQAQVSAPTNIEQHPIIHAALSEVIPLLRTRYHHSSNFTFFSLYTRA